MRLLLLIIELELLLIIVFIFLLLLLRLFLFIFSHPLLNFLSLFILFLFIFELPLINLLKLLLLLFVLLLLIVISPKSFEPLFNLSFSKSTTFSSTVISKFAIMVFNPSLAFNTFLFTFFSVFWSNSLSEKLLFLSTNFKFELGTLACV